LSPLKNYTVKEFSSEIVTFECEVKAKPNLGISYQWFFNGQELKHTEATLVRQIPKREHSGSYMCQAKNQVGATNSSIGKLSVTCE
jgi:Immunoglobulin I-set domain.